MARRIRVAVLWTAGWLLLGVMTRTSDFVIMRGTRGSAVEWLRGLDAYLLLFGLWALLAPLMVEAVQRWPVAAPHRLRNGVLHVGLAVVFAVVNPLLYLVIRWYTGPRPPGVSLAQAIPQQLTSSFLLGLQIYGTVAAITQLLWSHRALRERAVSQARLETQLSQARLATLRAQLQPHFLFNTLNSVSALMAHDVPAARRMIVRLSDLLRLSLEEFSSPVTSLRREMEFLDAYMEIQRTRFRDRLSVHYAVDEAELDAPVPCLLLQPLVENAIVHGIAPRPGPGRVSISAARVDGRLRLEVQDDGVGWNDASIRREGVGIGATRARLRALYGDAHTLALEDAPGGGARVRIEIPLQPAGEGDA